MIAEMNRSFVPLWVNVKKTRLPDLPAFRAMPEDHRRCVTGTADAIARGFNRAFYARSWVISPDGARLLNPRPRWNHEPTPEEYLEMLSHCQENMAKTPGSYQKGPV